MNVIKTRTADSNDMDFLFKLKVASMRQYVEVVYGWDESVQYGFFEKAFHPESIQVIQCDGHDVGMYELQERTEDWFLARIEILPSFQGKGIGKKLLVHRIAEIKRNQLIDTIIVRTSQHTDKFYEKGGFKLDFITKDYWAKGFDLYQMKIELTK